MNEVTTQSNTELATIIANTLAKEVASAINLSDKLVDIKLKERELDNYKVNIQSFKEGQEGINNFFHDSIKGFNEKYAETIEAILRDLQSNQERLERIEKHLGF